MPASYDHPRASDYPRSAELLARVRELETADTRRPRATGQSVAVPASVCVHVYVAQPRGEQR